MFLRRAVTFVAMSCALMTVPVGVAAGQNNDFTIEGYVFNMETLRPMKDVRVNFYQVLENGAHLQSITVTDANGSYVMAIPANLSGVQLVVQAICRKPKGYVGSLSVVRSDRGAVAGDAFHKNLYITLPRGITGCINDYR